MLSAGQSEHDLAQAKAVFRPTMSNQGALSLA